LVSNEAQNITDDLLLNMSDNDMLQLKNFCNFWVNFLSEDCEYIQVPDVVNNPASKTPGTLVNGPAISSFVSSPFTPLNPQLLDSPVFTISPSNWNGQFTNSNVGLQYTTLRQVISSVFSPPIGNGIDSSNSRLIDQASFQAVKLINNGIVYFKPLNANDKYVYITFTGPNASSTSSIQSSSSDGDIKSLQASTDQKTVSNPKGYVFVQDPLDSNKKLFQIITDMNGAIAGRRLFDYNRLTTPQDPFFQNPYTVTSTDMDYFSVGPLSSGTVYVAESQIVANKYPSPPFIPADNTTFL
jgi:hypothetical protein